MRFIVLLCFIASIKFVQANLQLNDPAPTPTETSGSVLSIFSSTYGFKQYFNPFTTWDRQGTQFAECRNPNLGDCDNLVYSGLQSLKMALDPVYWNPTDASAYDFFHIDFYRFGSNDNDLGTKQLKLYIQDNQWLWATIVLQDVDNLAYDSWQSVTIPFTDSRFPTGFNFNNFRFLSLTYGDYSEPGVPTQPPSESVQIALNNIYFSKATCPENERANGQGSCVACTGGRTRPAGDDPGGDEKKCNCASNERVNAQGSCEACTGGRINLPGDDPADGETNCHCLQNERVNSQNTCVACATGRTRDAGDDPDGTETKCKCAANERVDADGNCVACLTGRTRPSGDNPADGETKCNCAVNERVNNNQCVACPARHINKAGADPNDADTECLPLSLASIDDLTQAYRAKANTCARL